MLITMEHIRAGGGCAWGLRAFFARHHLDLQAFLRDGGIDSQTLLAIRVVELAQLQAQKEEK